MGGGKIYQTPISPFLHLSTSIGFFSVCFEGELQTWLIEVSQAGEVSTQS